MTRKEKISLVIPCYNEENSIPMIYEEIDKLTKKMKTEDFEIIFINDGSKDNSAWVIKELSKKDKRIKYLTFSRNFGKEAGMYAGLKESTGDYVAILDADLQDPPEMIKKMYNIIKKEKVDCVALYTESHEGYSLIRKTLTNIWYKLAKKISTSNQKPGARDFRLMTRQMTDAILEMKEYNRYLKGIYDYVGFETKWISYDAPNRKTGESKFNIWKLTKYAIEGMVAFSTKPLILATYIGLFLCLTSFIVIIIIIAKTLIWTDPVSGWPSLACLIVFIGGIQLFFLGIIGLYLSKLYLEVKRRPIYIVKEDNKNK